MFRLDADYSILHGFFSGTDKGSVAALFRAVGAHYFNHFSAVFLHGSTFSKHDSDCQLGNLYPIRKAEQVSFEQGRLKKANKISFRKGISKFVEHDFPFWHGWWIKTVHADPDVKNAITLYKINPTFDPTKHLKAAFSKMAQQKDLKNVCLKKDDKVKDSNEKRLSKYEIRAANLNGHVLSMIQQCGRKDNIGVTLAINNIIGPDDPPPVLKTALTRIIVYFVLAVINAGLRLGKLLAAYSFTVSVY